MKCASTLLTGSLLLSLMAPASAQLDYPPGRSFRSRLSKYINEINHADISRMDSPYCVREKFVPARGRAGTIDESFLRSNCEKLSSAKRRIYYLTDQSFRMSLQLRGIYIRQEILFFQMTLSNRSHLDYDMDSIRFYITDKEKRKNGKAVAIEIPPLYVFGNSRLIAGKSQESSVIALPKFTLPMGKCLVIQVLEKNGGRHLQLQADNYSLVRARLIQNGMK
jgi:conjugative transposon TraN protein